MGERLADNLFPVSCLPYLPSYHPTLLLCVNSYPLMRTPSLLSSCCYGSLRLSLGCFRFQRRCVLPASAFLRACPTLPLLLLTILSTFTLLQLLLLLNSCSLFILFLPLLPSLIILPL